MEGILKKIFFSHVGRDDEKIFVVQNLSEGKINEQYRITGIESHNDELKNFLFSLGCYDGEIVTLISILGATYVINIKEARYSIDKQLAAAIKVKGI